MKIVTGIAVLTTAEGERLTYTYSEVDDSTGKIIQSNIKNSFVVLEQETKNLIDELRSKVADNLNLVV